MSRTTAATSASDHGNDQRRSGDADAGCGRTSGSGSHSIGGTSGKGQRRLTRRGCVAVDSARRCAGVDGSAASGGEPDRRRRAAARARFPGSPASRSVRRAGARSTGPCPCPAGLRWSRADRTDRRRAAAFPATCRCRCRARRRGRGSIRTSILPALGERAGVGEQVADHHRRARAAAHAGAATRVVDAPAVRPACRPAAAAPSRLPRRRRRARRSPRAAARCRLRAPGSGRHRSPLPCRGRRAGSRASERCARSGRSGSACIRSLATRITVSGVRSSWLASRVKSRSRCTNARDALAHALQRAGQLPRLDAGVGRQLVRRERADVGIARIPAPRPRAPARCTGATMRRDDAIGEPRTQQPPPATPAAPAHSDQLQRDAVDARLRIGQVQRAPRRGARPAPACRGQVVQAGRAGCAASAGSAAGRCADRHAVAVQRRAVGQRRAPGRCARCCQKYAASSLQRALRRQLAAWRPRRDVQRRRR